MVKRIFAVVCIAFCLIPLFCVSSFASADDSYLRFSSIQIGGSLGDEGFLTSSDSSSATIAFTGVGEYGESDQLWLLQLGLDVQLLPSAEQSYFYYGASSSKDLTKVELGYIRGYKVVVSFDEIVIYILYQKSVDVHSDKAPLSICSFSWSASTGLVEYGSLSYDSSSDSYVTKSLLACQRILIDTPFLFHKSLYRSVISAEELTTLFYVDPDIIYNAGFDSGKVIADAKLATEKRLSYEDGYIDGYADCTESPNSEAFQNGYRAGKTEGESEPNGVKIANIVKLIIEAPFYMIQKVFNLELFGVNIGGLIFGIISCAIAFYIVKFILNFFM